jgi:exodeoxyribonuclease VII large subunit
VILLVRGGGSPEELAAFNEERLARAIFASRIPVVTGIGHQTDTSIADLVADHRAATPSLAAAAVVPDVGGIASSIARLHGEMMRMVRQRLVADRRRWSEINRRLVQARPETRLRAQRQRNDELRRRSQRAVDAQLRSKRAKLRALQLQLGALDPLAVLSRGYAVLTDETSGRVVKNVEQVGPGDRVLARLARGELRLRVEE